MIITTINPGETWAGKDPWDVTRRPRSEIVEVGRHNLVIVKALEGPFAGRTATFDLDAFLDTWTKV